MLLVAVPVHLTEVNTGWKLPRRENLFSIFSYVHQLFPTGLYRFFINGTPATIFLSFTSPASIEVRKKRKASVGASMSGAFSPRGLKDIPSDVKDNSPGGSCPKLLCIRRESCPLSAVQGPLAIQL